LKILKRLLINEQVPLKNEKEYFSHLNFYENIGFVPSSHSSFISMLHTVKAELFFPLTKAIEEEEKYITREKKVFFAVLN
jgi:hypothetical protein